MGDEIKMDTKEVLNTCEELKQRLTSIIVEYQGKLSEVDLRVDLQTTFTETRYGAVKKFAVDVKAVIEAS
jgi:hypothetical protein